MEIKLYDMIEKYVKKNIYIYELDKEDDFSLREKMKVSMGILNESISSVMNFFNKVGKLNLDEYIILYQNGILKWEENFYYYNIEKNSIQKEYSKETALSTKVFLEKVNNIKIIGTDIFEIKDGDNYNILDLKNGFSFYFSKPVDKINYIFSWSEQKKSWNTLNYIITYLGNENFCYSFLEEKLIKLPKIEFDDVLDISENTNTLVVKYNNEIRLYYQGEEVLRSDKFIQRRGNYYFFKIKNRVKIFNEKGKQLKKGFKVISNLPNKLTEKVIVLENTTNHKKNLLIFNNDFKTISFREEKIYNLKNKIFILYENKKNEEYIKTIVNLEGKIYKKIKNNLKPKAVKFLEVEPLEKSNLNIDILEIPYQTERGKFYYTDNSEENIYKTEYNKLYLVNLNERGFKLFFLKELPTSKFNIYENREEKAKYKDEKIEKVFLEKSKSSLLGINLFFYIIYKTEYIENKKLAYFYETFRKKYFFQYDEEKDIDRSILGEENEFYNLIKNKEDLDKLENEFPKEIISYFEKILK